MGSGYLDGGQILLAGARLESSQVPAGEHVLTSYPLELGRPVPTDDWPQLYLRNRSISNSYVSVLGGLLFPSLLCIGAFLPRVGRFRPSFFFLGAAFLLLETKAVTTLSILYGATWIVNSVVFFSFLLMILIENFIVPLCLRRSR